MDPAPMIETWPVPVLGARDVWRFTLYTNFLYKTHNRVIW